MMDRGRDAGCRGMGDRAERGAPAGQAHTEYVVILVVMLGLGFAVASAFIYFDAIEELFFDYYAGLANYLNVPFF